MNPNCDLPLEEGDLIYVIKPSPIKNKKLISGNSGSASRKPSTSSNIFGACKKSSHGRPPERKPSSVSIAAEVSANPPDDMDDLEPTISLQVGQEFQGNDNVLKFYTVETSITISIMNRFPSFHHQQSKRKHIRLQIT